MVDLVNTTRIDTKCEKFIKLDQKKKDQIEFAEPIRSKPQSVD